MPSWEWEKKKLAFEASSPNLCVPGKRSKLSEPSSIRSGKRKANLYPCSYGNHVIRGLILTEAPVTDGLVNMYICMFVWSLCICHMLFLWGTAQVCVCAIVQVWKSRDKLRCWSSLSTMFEARSLVHCCKCQVSQSKNLPGILPSALHFTKGVPSTLLTLH